MLQFEFETRVVGSTIGSRREVPGETKPVIGMLLIIIIIIIIIDELMGLTGFSWLRIGSSGGFCEHGDEPSGSINRAGYFLIS
jgi:hypothetical protein